MKEEMVVEVMEVEEREDFMHSVEFQNWTV